MESSSPGRNSGRQHHALPHGVSLREPSSLLLLLLLLLLMMKHHLLQGGIRHAAGHGAWHTTRHAIECHDWKKSSRTTTKAAETHLAGRATGPCGHGSLRHDLHGVIDRRSSLLLGRTCS